MRSRMADVESPSATEFGPADLTSRFQVPAPVARCHQAKPRAVALTMLVQPPGRHTAVAAKAAEAAEETPGGLGCSARLVEFSGEM